jgi:hypothetical protein
LKTVATSLLLAALALGAPGALPVGAQEVPAGAARTPAASTVRSAWSHQRAAECVAVLKAEALALAPRHRAGQTQVRGEMEQLTQWGFAMIGTAYKRGLRNPLADQLLEAADQAVARQTMPARQALSQQCREQGAQLLVQANLIERGLVANRARARVDKLLD